MIRRNPFVVTLVLAASLGACRREPPPATARASGYVEATEVRLASKVAGRVATVTVAEGQRVTAGQVLVTLSTTDTDLALRRARAEREQADAQWRLVGAGARIEDVRQAEAQIGSAESERRVAEAELASARIDEARFEQLLRARAGTEKQRDDALARRQIAEARVASAGERVKVAREQLARVKVGARPEELQAAQARIGVVDAQIAALQKDRDEATIVAPSDGVVTSRLTEPGELVLPRAPLLVILDLEHAWANLYVEERLVPGLKIDQAATIVTDAGDRLDGRIASISPQAEFTPRNVQTAEERAKLVYRVKVAVDNAKGILKPGMPVVGDFGARVK